MAARALTLLAAMFVFGFQCFQQHVKATQRAAHCRGKSQLEEFVETTAASDVGGELIHRSVSAGSSLLLQHRQCPSGRLPVAFEVMALLFPVFGGCGGQVSGVCSCRYGYAPVKTLLSLVSLRFPPSVTVSSCFPVGTELLLVCFLHFHLC